jgi:hypothetical protein
LNQASVVLVAYNQDGLRQLSSCNSMPAKEKENCDIDQYYVSATYNGTQSNFFDDNVIGITGYEVKKVAMDSGLLTPRVSGIGNNNFIIPDIQNPDQTVNGDLTDTSTQLNLDNSDDSVLITGNVEDNIDLKNGTNQLQVDGDANKKISGGNDQDTVRIGGNVNDDIQLQNGDDRLEVYGDANQKIDAGGGSDTVYIHGSVYAEIKMGVGDDKLKIDGSINASVKGENGTDELYLNYTTDEWNNLPAEQANVSGFERIFCTDGQCN